MKEQIEEMRKEVSAIHRFFMEDDDYEDLDDYIADELYNAGYRKQEWISVDDRLPEKEGQYLVYTGLCGIKVCIFRTSIITDRLSFEYNCTHWMPLPEPPKMKGGAE